MYDSPIYRKKMRNLVRLVKSLYPSMRRVPNPLPVYAGHTEESLIKNRELKESRRLDKTVLHYFAQTLEPEDTRRTVRDNNRENTNETTLKDSIKY